ncbi:hypothetical protein DRE_00065 [Drechslerella stenobrocha 248]|uniref:L-ornithine N(5)-oxygenase n=1 Tax=Drechslerella stenobrocha 248 TaxID=1043628 RepID=W7IHM4_9PEZI|nr:hypothetical protein DRE_00065 [Drechslerella stenobrocha 248]
MYSTALIVGAGESGMCMAIQLKKHGITDFAIYERHSAVGGTWYANTYPGVACDIPALAYSYSFATNPDWSSFYPQGPELYAYFSKVCDDHNLRPHITFNTEVESAVWDEDRKLWVVRLRKRAIADWELNSNHSFAKDLKYSGQVGDTWTHECKVLFTAVGLLTTPMDVKINGMENFNGPIFHSALWNHSVDLEEKDVVLIGNGCTACQVVPVIEPKVKSLTQITRSPHWMLPRPQFPGVAPESYEKWAPTVFRCIPGSLTVARYLMFLTLESKWLTFRKTEAGEKQRKAYERQSIKNVKTNAPEKYWDLLTPNYPIGFKRRIFDDTYLKSLHSDKVLLTRDEVTGLSEHTVHTASGKEYKADVLVLATGYKTNDWITPMDIVGRGGEHLSDHWRKMGGPAAYNCSVVSGFPNLFMVVGPNSATGHTSVILATENMVRYALSVAGPVLKGDASEVEIKKEAEVEYSKWTQETMKKTVFSNDDFQSWYKRADGWNSSTYPRSQLHFIYRSHFPVWKDWIITKTEQGIWKARVRRMLIVVSIFGVGILNAVLRKRGLTMLDAARIGMFLIKSTASKALGFATGSRQ